MIAVGITAHAQNPYKKFTQNLPFKMSEVKAPVIPNRQVNLRDFGAVNDGVTLNTQAFAKAIDALSKQGGGRLVVPQGV
jgi:polygalacturonase